MSISLLGKIETENKQSVENWLLDRVATVDLSVRFTPRFRQLIFVVFLSFWRFLSNQLPVIIRQWFDNVYMYYLNIVDKTNLLKLHNEGTCFTCHICHKKFSHSSSLKVHLHQHEGVKPYVCDECSMSFCTQCELKYHQLKHLDFKQFCCGSCGKYFKHKDCVVKHFNRCSIKLGYVSNFARQDWNREQTICGQLLVGQSCYCWLKTC